MLKEEYIAAAEAVAKRIHRTFDRKALSAAGWEALQELYRSDELDALLSGPDRHERFALWSAQNDDRVTALSQKIEWQNSERKDAIRKRIAELQLQLSLMP